VAADRTYTYSDAGDITAIADAPAGQPADNPVLQPRLPAPAHRGLDSGRWLRGRAGGALGGPAPYWQSYTYDVTGNRTSLTRHSSTGGPDSTDTSTYPAAGSAHPHAVQTVRHTGGTDSYTTDQSGNTTVRPGQTLTWDSEDHLAGTTIAGQTQNQHLRRRRKPVAPHRSQRHHGFPRRHRTVRAGRIHRGVRHPHLHRARRPRRGAHRLEAHLARRRPAGHRRDRDQPHHRRRDHPPLRPVRQTPATRPCRPGRTPTVSRQSPPTNLTGTTHLDARDYDRRSPFPLVDPVLEPLEPQQNNAYSYAWNNPVTMSDPTGLKGCTGSEHSGGCYRPGDGRPADLPAGRYRD